MAYGFTADEEQKQIAIARTLQNMMGDQYDVSINPRTLGGWAVFPKSSYTKRPRIVADVVAALLNSGYTIGRTQDTQSSKHVFAYIEVDGVAIIVGAARRGGLGVFPSTIRDMDIAIAETVTYFDEKNKATTMKATIKAKLTAEEIAFLGL